MGKKRSNQKKKKRAAGRAKKDVASEMLQEQLAMEESVTDFVVAEPEAEMTYEELLLTQSPEGEELPKEDDMEAMREYFCRSIVLADKRALSGKRKIRIPFERILSKLLWTAIMFALAGIIVWQGAEVVAAKIEYTRGSELYEDIANKHSLATGDEGMTSILFGEKNIYGLHDYEAMQNGAQISDKQTLTSAERKELAIYNAKLAVLKKQNPDTVGWIYIPGTNIDYPIVMPPADDPEYYMDHAFSGANYSFGAIYIETRCHPGILQNKNTIIVGHNIRLQGMMFNQLVKFGEEDFFNSHSEIYIYTEEGKFVFNLFSFYRVNQEYNFRRVNFRDDSDFLQYLETMRSHSWYQRSGLQFKADDRIITMYTCTNDNIKTNRYVAVAVLKNCLLNE